MKRKAGDYLPISQYGIIGDGHTAALVSFNGSIDWMCAPHFDSPSIFARLLDAKQGGHFSIRPSEDFEAECSYLRNSAVLRTTFKTKGGKAQVTDFMTLRTGEEGPEAPRRLVRFIEGIEGEVPFDVVFRPRPNYATRSALLREVMGGIAVDPDGEQPFRFLSNMPMRVDDDRAHGCTMVKADDEIAFMLDFKDTTPSIEARELHTAKRDLEDTLAFWEEWIKACVYRGPYEGQVLRSVITLKLLTFEPTGAMVAAPTTSFPEDIGGMRNWDYRYTWIRDASFSAYALFSAGHVEDGERFLDWVNEVALQCEAGHLRIMYGTDGRHDLPERALDHLDGYRGSKPVRVGNEAVNQFQLDVYGEFLDCFHTYRRFEHLSRERIEGLWPAFRRQVQMVAERWHEPDSGMWEMRGLTRHFVSSKVFAWVALDRGIKAAEELGLEGDLERWRTERDAIRSEVLQRGYDEEMGAFVQAYGEKALDASNLLMPLVHFIDPQDPRMRATVEAIEKDLSVDGLVHRYPSGVDNLEGKEGSFFVCSFWLVDNLTAQGRVDEARTLYERILERASPLGLFAEQIDPETGEHLGNFPQALTHLGLIISAVNLARAGKVGSVRWTDRDTHDVSDAVEGEQRRETNQR